MAVGMGLNVFYELASVWYYNNFEIDVDDLCRDEKVVWMLWLVWFMKYFLEHLWHFEEIVIKNLQNFLLKNQKSSKIFSSSNIFETNQN